jgi:heavy metal translocating P-type ATPase
MESMRAGLILLVLTTFGVTVGIVGAILGNETLRDVAWIATILVALVPVTWGIARDLLAGHAGVDVVAILAMGGALLLEEFLAGAVIGLMMATGIALEAYAGSRAERELSSLLERAPRSANRYVGTSLESVPVGSVGVGDRLLIKAGEVLPVDGVVASEGAVLDASALTGESRLVAHEAGDRVESGSVNAGSAFDLRAVAIAEESTYAGIVRLVEAAQRSKSPFVRMADRYAAIFVPIAVGLSLLAWAVSGDPVRGLAVLVVATPCPLLLAAPIAVVGGISRSAKRGIVVKGGASLEQLASAEVMLLDKTGTLTMGVPDLTEIAVFAGGLDRDDILRYAASLDQVSSHVLAHAIVSAGRQGGMQLSFPDDAEEVPGAGLRGRVQGADVRLGTLEWALGGSEPSEDVRSFVRRMATNVGTTVYLAVDGVLSGALVLDDPIRPDTPRTIRELKRVGIKEVVMVTGDNSFIAEAVGAAIGVDSVLAERTPAEKVEAVRDAGIDHVTLMVGDGINDAPALAAADVGVAMGARGATSSSEAADVVLIVDRLDRLVEAIQIARRSHRIAVQSVLVGMGLSSLAMLFAAFGFLPPVAGAITQEVIDAVAILIALRALTGPVTLRSQPKLDPEMSRRLRTEHDQLMPKLADLRNLADSLDTMAREDAMSELGRTSAFLSKELVPHERADDAEIYPYISNLIGGEDPLAAMSRTHREIFHLVRLFRAQVADLPADGPSSGDLRDLRRILYGLHAIVVLHFAQEEELYSSLDENYLDPAGVDTIAGAC